MDEGGRVGVRVDGRDAGPVSRVWNRAKMHLELVATSDQKDEFDRRTEWAGAYRTTAAHFKGRIVNEPEAQVRCDPKVEQQRVASNSACSSLWLWLDAFVEGALSDWYACSLLEPATSRIAMLPVDAAAVRESEARSRVL